MKTAVAKTALALAIALGAVALAPRDAHAGPWCAWYDPYTYNCGFETFQQCLATVRGIGGECRRNMREERTPRPEPRRPR